MGDLYNPIALDDACLLSKTTPETAQKACIYKDQHDQLAVVSPQQRNKFP